MNPFCISDFFLLYNLTWWGGSAFFWGVSYLEVQIIHEVANDRPVFSIHPSEFLNLTLLKHFDLRSHLYILKIKAEILSYCSN